MIMHYNKHSEKQLSQEQSIGLARLVVVIVTSTMNLLFQLELTSSTAFVAAAWPSSGGNHIYPPRRTSTFNHATIRGKPQRKSHEYRGGSSTSLDKNSNIILSADSTSMTSETTATISMNDIERNGMTMDNFNLLSDRGKIALQNLIHFDQQNHDQIHIYQNWPPPGIDDDNKIRLTEQV
jgi:hypothetical protein